MAEVHNPSRISKAKIKLAPRKTRYSRSSSGFGLIEILVSLVIGSLVMLAMTDMLTKTLKIGSSTQNESSANAIASEIIENLRQSRYDYLAQHVGTYDLLVNQDAGAANTAVQIRDTPLLFDFVNKVWTSKTVSAGFKGAARLVITQSPSLSKALKVTVTVSWSDGQFSAPNTSDSVTAGRIITTTTLITEEGTNDYTL
ncbi:MAG: prepilin-type N-terminal cleavage/methylation domain-containing protein [Candidatus Obscuribacterales bacterium]